MFAEGISADGNRFSPNARGSTPRVKQSIRRQSARCLLGVDDDVSTMLSSDVGKRRFVLIRHLQVNLFELKYV